MRRSSPCGNAGHAIDGAQSLNPEQFDALMGEVRRRAAFEGKQMQ